MNSKEIAIYCINKRVTDSKEIFLNEIVFEKYIINKEEVGEELLIARNVQTDNFLDKKCKSGITYQYRINAKDKDTLY